MFDWLRNLFRPVPDRTEAMLLKHFDFLLSEYGFTYLKADLGNYTDENGKILFYGPYYVYQFNTIDVCLNILHLVQRDEFEVYITEKQCLDPLYIRKGTRVPAELENNIAWLAIETKTSIRSKGELLRFKENKL